MGNLVERNMGYTPSDNIAVLLREAHLKPKSILRDLAHTA
jgi:hypothetical protein